MQIEHYKIEKLKKQCARIKNNGNKRTHKIQETEDAKR